MKCGRQYGVIQEEFILDDGVQPHDRFAYRVTKDDGNVFYKDYLKMVLGDDFTEVMGYADATAEKCGDVVEMWLGMLGQHDEVPDHVHGDKSRSR